VTDMLTDVALDGVARAARFRLEVLVLGEDAPFMSSASLDDRVDALAGEYGVPRRMLMAAVTPGNATRSPADLETEGRSSTMTSTTTSIRKVT